MNCDTYYNFFIGGHVTISGPPALDPIPSNFNCSASNENFSNIPANERVRFNCMCDTKKQLLVSLVINYVIWILSF